MTLLHCPKLFFIQFLCFKWGLFFNFIMWFNYPMALFTFCNLLWVTLLDISEEAVTSNLSCVFLAYAHTNLFEESEQTAHLQSLQTKVNRRTSWIDSKLLYHRVMRSTVNLQDCVMSGDLKKNMSEYLRKCHISISCYLFRNLLHCSCAYVNFVIKTDLDWLPQSLGLFLNEVHWQ